MKTKRFYVYFVFKNNPFRLCHFVVNARSRLGAIMLGKKRVKQHNKDKNDWIYLNCFIGGYIK